MPFHNRTSDPQGQTLDPSPDLRVLTPDHLADLRRSGLADRTIAAAGIRSVLPPEELDRLLRTWTPGLYQRLQNTVVSAYLIPYPNTDGFCRLRLFYNTPDRSPPEGLPKYLQPSGTPVRAYVPKGVEAYREKVHVPIWLTEGEKKALKLTQDGAAAIGLGGVWSFKDGDDLLADLREWNWRSRVVYLAFDADLGSKPQVQDALYELALRLTEKEAHVYIVTWDPAVGKGVDDVLVAGGATIADLRANTLPLQDFILQHGPGHRPAVLRALAVVSLPPVPFRLLANAVAKACGVRPKDVIAEVQARRRQKKEAATGAAVELTPEAEAFLRSPDLVDTYLRALGQLHPHDDATLLTLLLAWASLRIDPVAVIVKGEPSTGKTHAVEVSRMAWPEASYIWRSGLSPRVLAYTDENLANRMVILVEAPTLTSSDEAGQLLRTLISERRIVYETVERTPQGSRAKVLKREGPTGVIITTARLNIEPQLETRCWVVESRADPAYISAVLDHMRAREASQEAFPPDLDAIRAGLTWLYTHGATRVRIPEAILDAVRKALPGRSPVELRLWDRTVASIKASAFLHQLQRRRNVDGSVLADGRDLEVARRALSEAFTTALTGLTPAQRRVLDELRRMGEASVSEIARALDISKSTASIALRRLVDLNMAEHLEGGRYRRAGPDLPVPPDPFGSGEPKGPVGTPGASDFDPTNPSERSNGTAKSTG